VSAIAALLYYPLLLFFLCMIVRLIFDWVFVLSRYRATGPVAVLLEIVYSVTDPPLKAIRRVLPPLRIGGFSLDLGFIILIIAVQILMGTVRTL
jgi:YggT family protein